MFTIVGSGFGLYGYLPALVETFGEPVLLPEAYRAKVAARRELDPYAGAIRWMPDRDAALAAASGVVIATPPRMQAEVVARCLELPSLETLVLEKPVAPTPKDAVTALERLKRSGKRYRIGYSLLHTGWGAALKLPNADEWGGVVTVEWTFMAHHFAHDLRNWKRSHENGGGVLRFFGIHLVALLARHGYREVDRCTLAGTDPAEPERWSAVFSGPRLANCRVHVDSRAPTRGFAIALAGPADSPPLVELQDPFESDARNPAGDPRVEALKHLLATLRCEDDPYERIYDEANRLWQEVEAAITSQR